MLLTIPFFIFENIITIKSRMIAKKTSLLDDWIPRPCDDSKKKLLDLYFFFEQENTEEHSSKDSSFDES